jgi:hypothetical protein
VLLILLGYRFFVLTLFLGGLFTFWWFERKWAKTNTKDGPIFGEVFKGILLFLIPIGAIYILLENATGYDDQVAHWVLKLIGVFIGGIFAIPFLAVLGLISEWLLKKKYTKLDANVGDGNQ